MHSSRFESVSIRPTYSVTTSGEFSMYQWTKQSGSHRSSPDPHPLPSHSHPRPERGACVNPPNRLTGAVPTGEKNSVVTHRNIPPNSVLLPGQRGRGRDAIFPSVTWKREWCYYGGEEEKAC